MHADGLRSAQALEDLGDIEKYESLQAWRINFPKAPARYDQHHSNASDAVQAAVSTLQTAQRPNQDTLRFRFEKELPPLPTLEGTLQTEDVVAEQSVDNAVLIDHLWTTREPGRNDLTHPVKNQRNDTSTLTTNAPSTMSDQRIDNPGTIRKRQTQGKDVDSSGIELLTIHSASTRAL